MNGDVDFKSDDQFWLTWTPLDVSACASRQPDETEAQQESRTGFRSGRVAQEVRFGERHECAAIDREPKSHRNTLRSGPIGT